MNKISGLAKSVAVLGFVIAVAIGLLYFLPPSPLESLNNEISNLEEAILGQVDSYTLVINNARVLISSGEVADAAAWSEYFDKVGLRDNYRAISSIGYAERVAPATAGGFEKNLQVMYDDENIRIHPSGVAGDWIVLKFVYPYDEERRSALGLNVVSLPTQFAAIQRAVKSGLLVVSDKSVFAATGKIGFSITEPVYKAGAAISTEEERLAAFSGVIGASFSSNDFFGEIFEKNPVGGIRVRIYDGASERESDLLYDTDPEAGIFSPVGSRAIGVRDELWTIAYSQNNK